ncbi:MAG: riboflavin synthase [Desulfatitalea sp.]|nr:riboflavin synthase [Desulfatitalea sp.]
MFTGIIEGLGTLTGIQSVRGARRLTIQADFQLAGTRVGDSIAVNGACLTAVTVEGKRFSADISLETLARTTFGKAAIGDRVNLERAMRLSDRLDGHLVSGHVDGLATLKSRETAANAWVLTFGAPPELTRYLIVKGSVAVDGISLTINHCDAHGFQVTIIAHTAGVTTIGFKNKGAQFNIETDMIGKYVERFVTAAKKADPRPSGTIDMALLAKSGFMDH